MAYGTLTTLDTLRTTQQTVVEFGEDNAFAAIEVARQAHNALMRDFVTSLAAPTQDRLRRYGGPDNMAMDEVDEFGRADAQKISAGSNVGAPMRRFQISVQWTRDFMRRATTQELAVQFTAAMTADERAITREAKKALLRATNYNWTDWQVDRVVLPVKALINADSSAMPLGPNGEVFNGATHTHYLGTASFVAANLTSLIDTVIEHHNSGRVMVYINTAQEAAVRAFTGFTAYVDARIVQPGGATTAYGAAGLDLLNPFNRAIGLFGAAEIWVKPWMPANYALCVIDGPEKPLMYRTDPVTGSDLELAVENEVFPLRARTLERNYGFGVWSRTAAAVLYTGGASYVVPTITA